jgi:IS4 transposase
MTTILSASDYPKKALAALYRKSWHVEVDFRNIKTTLGINILSCKTPEMCRKEIRTYFLANHLIRLLMSQAANNYDLLPRQLSFKNAVQVWNTYALLDKVIDEEMLTLLAKRRVGKRNRRIEPRAVKRRPKAYPF